MYYLKCLHAAECTIRFAVSPFAAMRLYAPSNCDFDDE